jgi:hypothetical protein
LPGALLTKPERRREDNLMATIRSRMRHVVVAVVYALLAYLAISLGWMFIRIELRLSRNGTIAQQLETSLEARFPECKFRGVASYEKEVIYINVLNRLDKAKWHEIETWLREEKIEQKIDPQIWLEVAIDSDNIIIID